MFRSGGAGQLFNTKGKRLYCTIEERTRFLKAAENASRDVRTFCTVLAYTGCRPSEALGLTLQHIDIEAKSITFETLKKRRSGVFRAVPVPDNVLDALDLVHGVREAQQRKTEELHQFIWSWSRSTAYEKVKRIMREAKIEGPQATSKGLRHAFAIAALQADVPLNLVSRWMGHTKLENTAIYANALGAEERDLARRFWGSFPRSNS